MDRERRDSRGVEVGPVAVGGGRGGGRGGGGVSGRRGGRRHRLPGSGGRARGRRAEADRRLAVRYPFGVIGGKPAGAAAELAAQPTGFARLGFVHLRERRGGI